MAAGARHGASSHPSLRGGFTAEPWSGPAGRCWVTGADRGGIWAQSVCALFTAAPCSCWLFVYRAPRWVCPAVSAEKKRPGYGNYALLGPSESLSWSLLFNPLAR